MPSRRAFALLPLATPRTDSTGESRVIISLLALLDGDQERVALLTPVVHHDVDSRVLVLQPVRARSGQRSAGVVVAGDQRHQLPAAAEEAAEDVDGDVGEIGSDHDEVAADG